MYYLECSLLIFNHKKLEATTTINNGIDCLKTPHGLDKKREEGSRSRRRQKRRLRDSRRWRQSEEAQRLSVKIVIGGIEFDKM